jgi:hypothetical protein
MAIEFTCPSCGGTLRVEDDAVGQMVRCGGCMAALRVPDRSAAPPGGPAFPSSATSFPEAEPVPDDDRPPPPSRRRREESPPDEPPRLRRRKRRDPPPPTGRGPVFWMLLTLGVIGLGSCVFCCGLAGFLADENWHRLDSSRGGFHVEVPAPPRSPFRPHLFHGRNKFTCEGARVLFTEQEFFVMYRELASKPQDRDEAEKELDEAIAALRQGGIRVEGNPVAMDIDGFPGREFHFQETDGGQCMARAVVADQRVYILVAGGTLNPPAPDMVRRFFTSFRFTDPQILAAAGKLKAGNPPPPAKDGGPPAPKLPVPKGGAGPLTRPNRERALVAALGAELGNRPFIVAATAAATARNERARERIQAAIGGLGLALGETTLRAAERQQARALEEASVKAIGEAVGRSTFESPPPLPLPIAPPPRDKK